MERTCFQTIGSCLRGRAMATPQRFGQWQMKDQVEKWELKENKEPIYPTSVYCTLSDLYSRERTINMVVTTVTTVQQLTTVFILAVVDPVHNNNIFKHQCFNIKVVV